MAQRDRDRKPLDVKKFGSIRRFRNDEITIGGKRHVIKPDEAYYYDHKAEGDEVGEYSGFMLPYENERLLRDGMTPRVNTEFTWGRRGFPPDGFPHIGPNEIPGPVPGGFDSQRDYPKIFRLCGLLKRAWEYPGVLREFARNPEAYLTSDGKDGRPTVDELCTLLQIATGTQWSNVRTIAAATGLPAGGLRPGQSQGDDDDNAAALVVHLIHMLHGYYIPSEFSCK